MDVFYATNHLVSQHEDSLNGETARAEIEEIFQRGTQQIHD